MASLTTCISWLVLWLIKPEALFCEFCLASRIAGKLEGEGKCPVMEVMSPGSYLDSGPLCDCREIASLVWTSVVIFLHFLFL